MASTTSPNPKPPTKIGVILFPGFQLLDVAGPIDALNILSMTRTLHLSILAATLDPVSTRHHATATTGSDFAQSIVPTHTFDNPPEDLEVLIIPGGIGARKDENVEPVVQFVKKVFPTLRWCLTVCTGSWVLARTGLLDGKRATSNKRAFGTVSLLICFFLSFSSSVSISAGIEEVFIIALVASFGLLADMMLLRSRSSVPRWTG